MSRDAGFTVPTEGAMRAPISTPARS